MSNLSKISAWTGVGRLHVCCGLIAVCVCCGLIAVCVRRGLIVVLFVAVAEHWVVSVATGALVLVCAVLCVAYVRLRVVFEAKPRGWPLLSGVLGVVVVVSGGCLPVCKGPKKAG